LIRIGGDTAVVISRAGFLAAGETEVPAARERRATWTLRRTATGWQVAAYAGTATAN
jgi:ketosteroid isomerase-like protein